MLTVVVLGYNEDRPPRGVVVGFYKMIVDPRLFEHHKYKTSMSGKDRRDPRRRGSEYKVIQVC